MDETQIEKTRRITTESLQAEIDELVTAGDKLLMACTGEEQKFRELQFKALIVKHRGEK